MRKYPHHEDDAFRDKIMRGFVIGAVVAGFTMELFVSEFKDMRDKYKKFLKTIKDINES